MHNDMSTAVMWSKSKPGVEFQYGGRLGEFNGMSSEPPATMQGAATWVNSVSRFQSHIIHMPHCRVQSPGEINVMIVPHCRV